MNHLGSILKRLVSAILWISAELGIAIRFIHKVIEDRVREHNRQYEILDERYGYNPGFIHFHALQ